MNRNESGVITNKWYQSQVHNSFLHACHSVCLLPACSVSLPLRAFMMCVFCSYVWISLYLTLIHLYAFLFSFARLFSSRPALRNDTVCKISHRSCMILNERLKFYFSVNFLYIPNPSLHHALISAGFLMWPPYYTISIALIVPHESITVLNMPWTSDSFDIFPP